MNINDGEVDKGKGVLHIGQLQIPLSIGQLKQLPEGIIRIGMRPEHIALSEEGQEVTLQSVEVLGNESILNFCNKWNNLECKSHWTATPEQR